MLVIPAIDIRGGNVVRLSMGDFSRETIYHDSPEDVAVYWEKEGAEWLHIVDLDGARTGTAVNFPVIASIASRVKIPVEVGGGIRTLESAEQYIASGAGMVILGTGAVSGKSFLAEAVEKYGDKIGVSIDLIDGKIAVEGWEKKIEKDLSTAIGEIEDCGVRNLIVTDIKRDGMLAGIDARLALEITALAKSRVTVAGGVGSLEDIRRLAGLGLRGVIAGKALYSGRLDFKKALEAVSGREEGYV